MWVLDASVALRWILEEETHPDALAVLERLIEHPEIFAVPELFAFETYSVVCRVHPHPTRAYRLAILPHLVGGMLRYPMTEELAVLASDFVDMGLTGYDATYAALARIVRGRWLTFDAAAHRRIDSQRLSLLLGSGLPGGLWEEGSG